MQKALIAIFCLVLAACAPVLSRDVMKEADRNMQLDALKASPEDYKGRLYVLGGVIVQTRFTKNGSQIELLAVPVDSLGNPETRERSLGRVLAVYPAEKGLLDPVVYAKGREVTFAGNFVELRKGTIDDMEYLYPVFDVRQIHLWEERRSYEYPYPYYPYGPYSSPYPYWYHPYWGPWPPPPGWW